MSAVGKTYSFKDLVGALVNAIFGVNFAITGGNVGLGNINISMTTERTTHETAADGTVMPSYIAGDAGSVTIEMQQTSQLHHALLSLYNQAVTAANADDVSGWAATVLSFRTLNDGSTHIMNGVSFSKIPDKPYAANGQNVTWHLMAANVINM